MHPIDRPAVPVVSAPVQAVPQHEPRPPLFAAFAAGAALALTFASRFVMWAAITVVTALLALSAAFDRPAGGWEREIRPDGPPCPPPAVSPTTVPSHGSPAPEMIAMRAAR